VWESVEDRERGLAQPEQEGAGGDNDESPLGKQQARKDAEGGPMSSCVKQRCPMLFTRLVLLAIGTKLGLCQGCDSLNMLHRSTI
jgi:hypothetical protein